ncbi:hypothetical protein NVV76_05925 [Pediococcus ethanolidurans]|uniref:hypothetical protein n=1 Tax=Pediococcus ethanolidurans TaxID=319653 RepID=UPI0021E89A8C|nr:hypothetical protein [Pediococcus ethanolidurans]MCV3327698.1 hypothetical protein [Pediococcus ethanolidurans]
MALFGWTVFWGLIIFCIFTLGYAMGRDNGIQREQQRHNRIIWQDSKDYQWEHK